MATQRLSSDFCFGLWRSTKSGSTVSNIDTLRDGCKLNKKKMATRHKLNHVAIDQPSIKYTKLYNLFGYLFCVWLFIFAFAFSKEKNGTEPNTQTFWLFIFACECLFLRLIICFCVWFFIFAFDSLFLRLTVYFCVWSFKFAFAYLLLRSVVCFCVGINIQKNILQIEWTVGASYYFPRARVPQTS